MKKAFITLGISLFVISLFAQKTVSEWAEPDHKTFFKKSLFGESLYLLNKFRESPEQLPDIKTVGLIGFSIFQPTYGTFKTTNEKIQKYASR